MKPAPAAPSGLLDNCSFISTNVDNLVASNLNDVRVTCVPSIFERPFTIGSILKAIEENPSWIGSITKDLEQVTYNTTAHERRKLEMKNLLFQALSTHPQQAYPLSEKIVDPLQPDRKKNKYRFYVLCSG